MKRGYLAAGIVCLAVGILFGLRLLLPSPAVDPLHTEVVLPTPGPSSEPPVPSPSATPEPYVSPIDFDALHAENPDIYAWLQITDTDVSYPVLQRAGDDSFYLDHNSKGAYSAAGALFTESAYNGTDLSDPATIIYGHRMNSGTLFGSLQPMYSARDTFEQYHEIVIYQPEQELHYEVFAAVPYDKRHILYTYDFDRDRMYRTFLDSVYAVRAIGANFAEGEPPEAGERLLILSTCLNGDRTRRYLVLARLVA